MGLKHNISFLVILKSVTIVGKKEHSSWNQQELILDNGVPDSFACQNYIVAIHNKPSDAKLGELFPNKTFIENIFQICFSFSEQQHNMNDFNCFDAPKYLLTANRL